MNYRVVHRAGRAWNAEWHDIPLDEAREIVRKLWTMEDRPHHFMTRIEPEGVIHSPSMIATPRRWTSKPGAPAPWK